MWLTGRSALPKVYETTFIRPARNREVIESQPIVLRRQANNASTRKARYYQVDAYRTFETCLSDAERPNCFLISPTASGKSLVMVMMARRWIQRGRKVIFVVPRNSIKGGFVSQSFWVEDEYVQWNGPINLTDNDEELEDGSVGEVKGLIDFLDGPRVEGEESWICTDQTFFAALDVQGVHELLESTAVIVDEAHHLSSEGEDLGINGRNRGGATLALLLRLGIPHMLCTATPFRADGNNILPQLYRKRYIEFTRQKADHISEFTHVDGYKATVVVGQVMELLEARLINAKNADLKVLVALPHVTSYHARRFARQLGLNPNAKDTKLQFELAIMRLCERLGLTCASVVRDESFKDVDRRLRRAFVKLAREGSTPDDLTSIPDVTLVQERYKEGTDCVAWSLCIQIGLSNSCVFNSQFPGRVLRDHWSKAGHIVEFCSLVPDHDGVDQDEKAQWTQNVILAILQLSIMDVDLRRKPLQVPTDLAKAGQDRSCPCPDTAARTATPDDVNKAFARFVQGTCSPEDLTLLLSAIPETPDLPKQSLEQLPRLPVDWGRFTDHEILMREVSDRMIAFASVIGKLEARAFRDRLAKSSGAHLDLEIERLYIERRCSPHEIAAALRSEANYVRKLLLAKRLLRPQDVIRSKPAVRRKKISGTR